MNVEMTVWKFATVIATAGVGILATFDTVERWVRLTIGILTIFSLVVIIVKNIRDMRRDK